MMEIGTFYDATRVLNEMVRNLETKAYEEGNYEKVYVCLDVTTFWVVRIISGYNAKYQKDKDSYLIEKNDIDMHDVAAILSDKYMKKMPQSYDNLKATNEALHTFINEFDILTVIKIVLRLDDEKGLDSAWVAEDAPSLIKAVDIVEHMESDPYF